MFKVLFLSIFVAYHSASFASGLDITASRVVARLKQKLKKGSIRHRGQLCEHLARMQLEDLLLDPQTHKIFMDVEIVDDQGISQGDLDLVVVDMKKRRIEFFIEVKCGKSLPNYYKEVERQKRRFHKISERFGSRLQFWNPAGHHYLSEQGIQYEPETSRNFWSIFPKSREWPEGDYADFQLPFFLPEIDSMTEELRILGLMATH